MELASGCREADDLEYGFGMLLDANSCSREKTASLSVTTGPSPAPQPCHPARSPHQGRVEGGPRKVVTIFTLKRKGLCKPSFKKEKVSYPE